jgi:signal transduction histidine kinase
LSVAVVVKDDVLRIVVADDGKGLPADVSPSGLGNLGDRAEAVGGTFSLGSGPEGGVRVEWSAPVG